MSLKHGILGLLSLKPYTGYELSKEFSQAMKHIWHTKTTQVYVELNNMEQKGWLVSHRVIQDDRPNKKVYTITEEGRLEFLNWLANPKQDVEKALLLRNGFLLRVLFAGNTSTDSAIALLESFREVCLNLSTAHGKIYQMIDKDEPIDGEEHAFFYRLVVRYGEIMVKARLEWIEEAIETIKMHYNKNHEVDNGGDSN